MPLDSEVTNLDAESFYRLVLIVRGIAVSRPQNLVKFADSHASIQDVVLEDPLVARNSTQKNDEKEGENPKKRSEHLLLQLMDVLWLLHELNPEIPALAPVVVPGLKYVFRLAGVKVLYFFLYFNRYTEQVIHSLVEIIHAFQSSEAYSNVTISLYLQLLLCQDPVIAFSAKQALCKVRLNRIT